MIERKDKLLENPGPGSYAAENVKVVATVQDKSLNSFSTNIERFCPTHPGGSIFKAPSYTKNPGPGTHFQSLKFMGHPKSTDAKRAMYGTKQHNAQATVPKAGPPGIPGKKIAPQAYSGLNQDTVGPALYNPIQDAQKFVAPIHDFVVSKTERHLWEPQNKAENTFVPRDIPGPGKYDRQDPEKMRNFNAKGEESVFLSRVPNCKDAKIKN